MGKGKHIGHFTAVVEDHGIDKSKSGKPFIWISVRCKGKYMTGSRGTEVCDIPAKGFLWLTSEKSIDMSLQTINSVFNLQLEYRQLDMMNSGNLKGKLCDVTLEEEEYNGKRQITVGFFNQLGKGMDFSSRRSGKVGLKEIEEYIARAKAEHPEEPGDNSGRSGDEDLPY